MMIAGCTHPAESPADSGPDVVGWSHGLGEAVDEIGVVRGYVPTRSIVHLHSPWSHDACDGEPMPGGVPDESCLQDLRDGLCITRVDLAFVTDHPSFAADQTFEAMFHHRDGDTWVDGADGGHVANQIHCDNGHVVTWVPGYEDELMPVGLHRQVADNAEDTYAITNGYDAAALDEERAASAIVFTAHTEQRDPADLARLQDAGLTGTELFNLHAAFAPNIRADYLGLGATSWVPDAVPFLDQNGTAEPDLFVLSVLSEHTPSVQKWDALLARGPMVGTAGTDAHQNVLPTLLRDGERGDSYRRMLRWFSNVVLVGPADGEGPDAVKRALAAGRTFVAFEVLGTPNGFDFHLTDDGGAIVEMGAAGTGGTVTVACPGLSVSSPHGLEAPELTATIFKDGAAWATGCGDHPTDGPGVYRVRIDMIPRHLTDFLGADPAPWMRPFPWIYSNAIRVQ